MRLAIDTSGLMMSAALAESGRVVTTKTSTADGRIAEGIDLLVADLLAEAGRTVHDISEIVVGLGPGSFTGVRTGIAAALGMSVGLGVPLFGANILQALAVSMQSEEPVAAYRSASSNENFVAVYCRGRELVQPLALAKADFLAQLTSLAGEAPQLCEITTETNISELLCSMAGELLSREVIPVYIKPVNARTIVERKASGS